jgi:hypothetical protein
MHKNEQSVAEPINKAVFPHECLVESSRHPTSKVIWPVHEQDNDTAMPSSDSGVLSTP